MPPKKPLTKKQLQDLKKQQIRKKEEEEKKKKQEQEKKQAELLRLKQIEEQNRIKQQIKRLEKQKKQYEPKLKNSIHHQQESIKKISQKQNWRKYISAEESSEIEGSDLTTFISQYQESKYKTNEQILHACQHSEAIADSLEQKVISYRGEKNHEKQEQTKNRIRQVRKITMKKLQDIMTNLANQADSFVEQRIQQIEMIKKLSETKKHDQKKNDETISYKTNDIKIGVFLSSSINKNTLKFKPAQIKQFGMNSQIPGKIINSNLIIKFEWTDFDPYSSNQYYPFKIIGGVYTLEFFDMLTNSKKIGNWTLKTDYNGKQILDKSRVPQSGQKQSFHLTYQLPEYVYLQTVDKNNIKIAGWDGSKWHLLSPQTIEFDPIKKSLYFQTSKYGSFAYVQDRCADYPYLSWELRTVKPNVVHLDLFCKRQVLKFEIGQNYAKLILKDKDSELGKFTKDGFTPEKLLHQLSLVGIHLLPIDQDYETANLVKKDKQSQQNAIRDIAYALNAFYIRSHKHNQSNIIVKIRQNLEYDEVFLQDQQKDWKKICWWSNKCGILNKKNTNTHLNLEILLSEHDIVQADCLKRIKQEGGYLMKRTLIKFLRLTRILSFITDK